VTWLKVEGSMNMQRHAASPQPLKIANDFGGKAGR
jgi:hypothetical protein